MKFKYLIVSFIISFGIALKSLAQTPDELIQTWYLYYTEADLGDSPMFYYGEDVPRITLYDNNAYDGIENCWDFNGQYQYEENGNDFPSLIMGSSNSACVLTGSSDFVLAEILNWDEVPILSLDLESLVLETFPGFIFEFKNEVTLGLEEFSVLDLKIHPNPTEDLIQIDYSGQIHKLEVYDSSGKLLITKQDDDLLVNIGNYKSGIYFLKIKTDLGIIIKRVLKK